ncbi:transglycosylase SLT domain-containing protein [Salmonella enterica subsp. enterica]|nr:transglycosylase SLT domain-containing protein [Salmonella enterica subsp. enterica]
MPVKRAMQWMPISEKPGRHGVDPHLITAIIAIESGGNPNAVSKSNAIGLMQLPASTLRARRLPSYGLAWRTDHQRAENPERNISMGAAYSILLKWAAGRHQRSAGDAICAGRLLC